jgi:WD40 repeat protein
VAFSADGRRVLTGSRDGTARVWDTERGQTLCILSGQREPIYAVALSPDGRTAVSGGSTATLRIWDTATGRELSALSGHTGEVSCVAMTGSLIVSGDRDGVVRVWSLPPRSGEGGQQGEASLLPSGTLDR